MWELGYHFAHVTLQRCQIIAYIHFCHFLILQSIVLIHKKQHLHRQRGYQNYQYNFKPLI